MTWFKVKRDDFHSLVVDSYFKTKTVCYESIIHDALTTSFYMSMSLMPGLLNSLMPVGYEDATGRMTLLRMRLIRDL